ncbi:monocarboxylate transporter 12 [Elysia marginata]|uniref:Monocarboxylate transporter 12 n=1 Tax=Elysia marginata TaxID=1093978 RepID=A0AAV4HJ21_9GAST|nr:monocarboxylate transporter 12 [Elysia marginata]
MSWGKPALPIDKGWAWLVMFGSFINITIVISFNRASGLFVTHFLDQFQESATSTTLAFGAAPFVFSLCNILLPSVLLPRFRVRTLVFVGGIFSGISVTSMAFAQSMLVMTLCFCVMGFAHGLIFVPQTVLIGLYFKKRLSFANAFAYMGMAAAAIVSPIIARLLLDGYGLQGTLLLYGAFTFNILPAALLLRPVSVYNTDITENVVLSDDNATPNENACTLLDQESSEVPEHNKATPSCNDDGELIAEYIGPAKSRNVHCLEEKEYTIELTAHESCHSEEIIEQLPNSQKDPQWVSGCVEQKETNSTESSIDNFNSKNSSHDLNEPCEVTHTAASYSKSKEAHCDDTAKCFLIDKKCTKSKVLNDDTCSSPSTTSSRNIFSRCFSNVWAHVRRSVYSNPLALLLLLASGLCVHTQPSLTYLPSLGEENGLSPKQVPYLLTTAGVSNLVGKLVIGYIADLRCCSRSRLYMVAGINLVLGGVFHLIRLCEGFGLMMWLSVALGTLSGVVDFMLPVLVSDILGKEHIGHMMSGFLLANGVFMSTDHVIVGALKDATGFFYISYHYMGALTLLGVVVFMIVPIVARIKANKRREKAVDSS